MVSFLAQTLTISLISIDKHYAIDIADPIYAGRVSYELRNRPRSPWSLCGSMVEHRSAESEGLRFDFSWGPTIFSLSHAREKTIYSCPHPRLKSLKSQKPLSLWQTLKLFFVKEKKIKYEKSSAILSFLVHTVMIQLAPGALINP